MINFDVELDKYRKAYLTPEFLLESVKRMGSALVAVSVGFGKTMLAQSILSSPHFLRDYDIIIYVTDTHAILNEVVEGLSNKLSPEIIHILQPRPKKLCGSENKRWSCLEKSGNSAYAKNKICRTCENKDMCTWVNQLSINSLMGKKVILGVADYLKLNNLLPGLTSKKRVLLIIDESKLITGKLVSPIYKHQIVIWRDTLNDLISGSYSKLNPSQKEIIELYIDAAVNCFDKPSLDRLNPLPPICSPLNIIIQSHGLQRLQEFIYLGYEFYKLSRCHSSWRWSDRDNGSIYYRDSVDISSTNFIILSANLNEEIAKHRLDHTNIKNCLPEFDLLPPESKFYNIQSSSGSKKHFIKKRDSLFYTFAWFIHERIKLNKKILLISKKCFLDIIKKELPQVFYELFNYKINIIVKGFDTSSFAENTNIPLINYGIQGINTFKTFDCALCLNSYYLNSTMLKEKFEETLPCPDGFEFSIKTPNGRRRIYPKVFGPDAKYSRNLANQILFQFETAIIEQVIGRIRPLTIPGKEVVFFNRNSYSPIIEKNVTTFNSIREFAKYFNIPASNSLHTNQVKEMVIELSSAGYTKLEISKEVKRSLSTVYRYFK